MEKLKLLFYAKLPDLQLSHLNNSEQQKEVDPQLPVINLILELVSQMQANLVQI